MGTNAAKHPQRKRLTEHGHHPILPPKSNDRLLRSDKGFQRVRTLKRAAPPNMRQGVWGTMSRSTPIPLTQALRHSIKQRPHQVHPHPGVLISVAHQRTLAQLQEHPVGALRPRSGPVDVEAPAQRTC